MKVIYAIWTYKPTPHPFMVIYDTAPFSATRSLASNNWHQLDWRWVAKDEEDEIKAVECTRRYLTFSYSDISKLIADEAKYGITVPADVIKRMRAYKIDSF